VEKKITKKTQPEVISVTQIQDDPQSSVNAPDADVDDEENVEKTNLNVNVNEDYYPILSVQENPIKEISISNPLPEIESITERTSEESVIDGPTPIQQNEILKLETEVDKTIENANNVVDVPMPPYQQEDKILEQIVHMFSRAPEEITTSTENTDLYAATATTTTTTTTTTIATTITSTILESTTTSTVVPSTQQNALETAAEIESDLSPTISEKIVTVAPTTIHIPITITAPTEAETIFTLINNDHNEHINVFHEKLPIVITTEKASTVSLAFKKKKKRTQTKNCR
jgi:hypothetical protein